MTILGERQWTGNEGQLVGAAAGSTFMDVFWAARRQALEVDNSLARTNLLEEAYDKRIEAIKGATGQSLVNPFRRGVDVGRTGDGLADDLQAVADMTRRQKGGAVSIEDYMNEFDVSLRALAEQRPEHRGVILPERSPREDAYARRNAAEKRAGEALNQYHGPGGTGTIAAFAGGFAGALQDPVNVASMGLGPMAGVGQGLKGLVWMAVRQGAWNAGTEAALQPTVAEWRREAGLQEPALGYDAGDFARNVGTAFAFGAGLDLGVRGGYRAIQAARGRVPILNADGTVKSFGTPDEALEAAALRTRSETLRAARDGDEVALRRLAEEAGVGAQPEVKAMLDALDNRAFHDPREPGTDRHEGDAALGQVARHLADPLEPMPVVPRPLPVARGASLADGLAPDVPHGRAVDVDDRPVWREPSGGAEPGHALVFERADGAREVLGPDRADAWIMREADGWTRAEADVVAARTRLQAERLDPVDAALLMREHPGAVDARVSLAGAELRMARALARLDEVAFDRVLAGETRPEVAALVGDLVPDKAEHGGILAALDGLEGRSERELRQAIGLLMRRDGAAPPMRAGIDDPFGPEGDVQIAELERLLRDDIAAAEGRAPLLGKDEPPIEAMRRRIVREALDEAQETSFAGGLEEAAALERLAQLIGVCKL